MRIKLLLTLVLLPLSWPSFLTASSHSVVLSSSESSIDQSESSEVWRSLTPENWRNAVYHKGSFFEDLTNEYQETLEETKNIYQKGRRIVVIELGCGTGDFLFNTGQKADYLIGVDFNIDFLEFAKKEKAKNRFKNVQFIHGDGNVLNDLLHEHAPSWIWEDDVLRIVACVGNTFGVIPQEMKANCMQQMLLAAGTEGFIFVGYWNGKAFPEAVANFYAKNQTLCGSFSEENVDY